MSGHMVRGLLACALTLTFAGLLHAAEPVSDSLDVQDPMMMEPLPVPADPELEALIEEVQDALGTIHQQMVRRKEAIHKSQDATAKTKLYEEFERLRKDREDLEAVLHDLVDEAKRSQRTAIDESLARARWFERQQDSQAQLEELIRDRQE